MRFLYTFLTAFACFVATVVTAAPHSRTQNKELIGNLAVSDILIQPRFIATEDDTNNFELDRSYFFLSWKMNNQLSAHFGVGRQDLVNHNARLSINTDANTVASYDDFSFFEAYAQLETKYGTVRAGVIPLMFGWEGVHKESEWIFPRTLFYGGEDESYRMQNFGLRDQGVAYYVDYKNFYTQAAVHNGENGKDLDGKIWHTAVVGWKNKSGLEGALSMSNGKYQSKTNTDPELDFSYGNAFFGFQFYDLMLLGEGFVGEEKREFELTPGEGLKKRFWDWHVDASHPIVKGVAGLARYEIYDPNSNAEADKTQRFILGVGFSNELRTSNLYLWGIKNKEEGVDLNNNQFMVVWKVRSLSIF
ncbi:MAG: hypothetical protein V4596_03330 [Bdellovibrionota bacterium]